MGKQQKKSLSKMTKVISLFFALFILSSSDSVFSQSFYLSKKLYPFSNNFVYQLYSYNNGRITDSTNITSPVNFYMWDSIQFCEIDSNEFVVFHQFVEYNSLTFDTLFIMERYLTINGKLHKQSGSDLKKLNKLSKYGFCLRKGNLTVFNKTGGLVKTYILEDCENLDDLANEIVNNLCPL